MSQTTTLRRRLRRVEKNLEEKAERESWRGTRESKREFALGYFLSGCQGAFYFGGFYDLARYWAFKLNERVHGHLEPIAENWARRYKATPEQRERALEDVRRGLAEPFKDRDAWSRYWWGGPFPPRDPTAVRPSGYDLRDWLHTNPPRWEIAVALDISKDMPASRRHKRSHPANRLQRDIKEIDKHFGGPRTRRKEAQLAEIQESLGLPPDDLKPPRIPAPQPTSPTPPPEPTAADRLRRRVRS